MRACECVTEFSHGIRVKVWAEQKHTLASMYIVLDVFPSSPTSHLLPRAWRSVLLSSSTLSKPTTCWRNSWRLGSTVGSRVTWGAGSSADVYL